MLYFMINRLNHILANGLETASVWRKKINSFKNKISYACQKQNLHARKEITKNNIAEENKFIKGEWDIFTCIQDKNKPLIYIYVCIPVNICPIIWHKLKLLG